MEQEIANLNFNAYDSRAWLNKKQRPIITSKKRRRNVKTVLSSERVAPASQVQRKSRDAKEG